MEAFAERIETSSVGMFVELFDNVFDGVGTGWIG